jgi:very-short-patch-repair endonuclease
VNWDSIRQFYDELRDEIKRAGRNEWAHGDAYLWEHAGGITLTPIERWLWSDIRALDAVLYPQYPVGRFFVDFANPIAKVAVECDGQAFHKDKAKDADRDSKLEQFGWKVFRFPGWECRTDFNEETMTSGSAYLRLKKIADQYAIRRGSGVVCE